MEAREFASFIIPNEISTPPLLKKCVWQNKVHSKKDRDGIYRQFKNGTCINAEVIQIRAE